MYKFGQISESTKNNNNNKEKTIINNNIINENGNYVLKSQNIEEPKPKINKVKKINKPVIEPVNNSIKVYEDPYPDYHREKLRNKDDSSNKFYQ